MFSKSVGLTIILAMTISVNSIPFLFNTERAPTKSFLATSSKGRQLAWVNGNVDPNTKFPPLFGSVRGGGIFDKNADEKSSDSDKAEADDKNKSEKSSSFPAMSQEEVENALAHIPIFAVTDAQGQGVVLKEESTNNGGGENSGGIFYFFMTPEMANSTLTQLKESGGNATEGLRVSAFSLGKVYFKMFHNDTDVTSSVKLGDTPSTTASDSSPVSVSYRLVPDSRDLIGARMLLNFDEKDGEELKKASESGKIDSELTQKAMRKAMSGSERFNKTYNEIPVFLIQQMRMKRTPEGMEQAKKVSTEKNLPSPQEHMLPMYFNLQSMVTTWQSFITGQADAKDVEPAIHLMDLKELVTKMMDDDTEIDFRSVLLIPPSLSPGLAGSSTGAASGEGFASTAPQTGGGLGGGTLGDL